MTKVYETLKKKNDTTVEVYPNIERTNIPDGAINTAKVEDASITTNKIVDNAVTTAKINDGAVTPQKMAYHLYEHNIICASTNTINDSSIIVAFKILTTIASPFNNAFEVASLLYDRDLNSDSDFMTASGRYDSDSFRVVTDIDFGAQTEDNDYCDSVVIGVYGDIDSDLYIVYETLSENDVTKISSNNINPVYFVDNVVTLF